jgi:hypothetical protein
MKTGVYCTKMHENQNHTKKMVSNVYLFLNLPGFDYAAQAADLTFACFCGIVFIVAGVERDDTVSVH